MLETKCVGDNLKMLVMDEDGTFGNKSNEDVI